MQLYTKNINIANRLNDIDVTITFLDEEKVETDALFICEPNKLTELCLDYPTAKILVLTPTPNFNEGMVLLQKGIRGYGNAYMQKVHLMQALQTIKNDAVWMYPEMMQELIAVGSNAAEHNEDVLAPLSAREQEVAKEIEKGESNKEIAIALGITERTVKAHLSSIYEKLEVGDRLALAMLLRK